MTINRKKTAIALAISSAIFLSACNDDDNHNTGSDPAPGSSAPLTLTAMDGYIKNAFICADVNENNACEASEIIRDLNGNYVVTNTAGKVDTHISLEADALLKKHTLMIATVRTFDSDSDIFSEDMDLPEHSMNPITLRAPAGSKMISPITDLVVAKMNIGENLEGAEIRAPKMGKEQAQKEVVTALKEIDPDKLLTQNMLYSDYLIDKSDPEASRQMLAKRSHKVAQILAESKSNATSDALFDKYSDEVLKLATTAVAQLTETELDDKNYKPYVSVGKKGTGDGLIINEKVTFNQENMKVLAKMLVEEKGIAGIVGQWDKSIINLSGLTGELNRVGIEALITDQDDVNHEILHQIVVANKTKLKDNNLDVHFDHLNDNLIISRLLPDEEIPGGEYSILISTNDLNADAKRIIVTDEQEVPHDVLTTSMTELKFIVENENLAPKINEEKRLLIVKQIEDLNLTQGETVQYTKIDIEGLFTDENGGNLAYSYEITDLPEGIILEDLNDTQVAISGMPVVSAKEIIVKIIAKDVGELTTTATLNFDIAEGNSDLIDTVTKPNSIWYQWITKTDDGVSKAYCQGIKLTSDVYGYNGHYVAISTPDTCPSEKEFIIRKISGTWQADNSMLLMTSNEGAEMRFTGVKSHIETSLPSITTFEMLIKPWVYKLSDGTLNILNSTQLNGVTLYEGYDVAQKSWNDATASSYIAGQAVIALNRFTRSPADQNVPYADVSVFFNNTKCAKIGITLTESENKEFPLSKTIWSKITATFKDKSMDLPLIQAYQDDHRCHTMFRFNVEEDIKLGDNLAMTFIAKDSTSNSDMVISGFADRNIFVRPKYDLDISAYPNGITIFDKDDDDRNKDDDDPIYYLKQDKEENPLLKDLNLDKDKKENNEKWIKGIEYKAENSKSIYQFETKEEGKRKIITIWSDKKKHVSIDDGNNESPIEYRYKKTNK